MFRILSSVLLTVLAFTAEIRADELPIVPKPSRNSPDEPFAKQFSRTKSAEFLDGASLAWTRDQKCGACHTSYPYLMARPLLKEAPALKAMRQFFEDRVANWNSNDPALRLDAGSEGITEVVATAATLAFDDARTGKLHPITSKALDKMWSLQQSNGVWDWNKHELPPMEYDDYFGAVYAALGVGVAPEGYAERPVPKAGLKKLRQYLQKNPPPNLHHKAWLLWASLKLDGLMTAEQRQETIKELQALQRSDGGWSLPSLGNWKRLDGQPNDPKTSPSDGYATGLIIYVLRQAGVSAKEPSMRRGADWLKTNQRASGRWFTRSLNADRAHYITNAGTAFAVMALTACDERSR